MYAPPTNSQQPSQQSPSTRSPSRPSTAENPQLSNSPGSNRRRTSSFGFNSNFFSNITNSLRNSSSSSNLTAQINNPQPPPTSGSRSRANSSSRLNLIQNFQIGNSSSNNITRSPRNHSTPNLEPPNNNSLGSHNYNNLEPQQEQARIGTPTDDYFQGQTRSNSLRATTVTVPKVPQKLDSDGTYSIRLTPFIDHSSTAAGLYFAPILRKTKPSSRLSVGRYTEKVRGAAQAPSGSDAGVVFKSKVVSRIHAEFYVDDYGNWHIKDLKSSSGTFLNHLRLSPAGVESLDTPLQNGDVLQLGMDFRGGSEDVFRCVKMRVEMNKSWQRKAKQFNKEVHEKFKNMAHLDDSENTECAICLQKIKPCQTIFISPCSHCWHYKCIRQIVVKSYPQFLCPNCRETCDLEADDEESELESSDDDDDDMLDDVLEYKNEADDLILEEEDGFEEENHR